MRGWLARSRSYPGFSIGILLSVKVILPVNGVFIPALNEIHRSTRRGREGAMTKRGERIPHYHTFFSLLLLISRPLGHTIENEKSARDKQVFIKVEQMKLPISFHSSSLKRPLPYLPGNISQRERIRERESEKGGRVCTDLFYANEMLYS